MPEGNNNNVIENEGDVIQQERMSLDNTYPNEQSMSEDSEDDNQMEYEFNEENDDNTSMAEGSMLVNEPLTDEESLSDTIELLSEDDARSNCYVCDAQQTHVNFDCGHSCCNTCTPNITRRTLCPVCHTRESTPVEECLCCADRNIEVVFRPCLHFFACLVCALTIYGGDVEPGTRGKCPMCRRRILPPE